MDMIAGLNQTARLLDQPQRLAGKRMTQFVRGYRAGWYLGLSRYYRSIRVGLLRPTAAITRGTDDGIRTTERFDCCAFISRNPIADPAAKRRHVLRGCRHGAESNAKNRQYETN